MPNKKSRGRPKKDPADLKQTYNYRFHPKTKAMIEWFSAWELQSETAFIEASCNLLAAKLEKKRSVYFDDIYHSHDGVRWLRTYLVRGYPLTREHEQVREFVRRHKQFFYRAEGRELVVDVANTEALWPKLKTFMNLGGVDAGLAMAEALTEHGLVAPQWPPRSGNAK